MTWYARHASLLVAALLFGVMAGTAAAVFWPRPEAFTVRRSGKHLEVWQSDQLLGEYEAQDGEVYEFLRDLEKGRLLD